MRIPPIKSGIKNFVETRKYMREQKFMNKYVSIDMNINADAYKELYKAKKPLASYAKSKDVRMSFTADKDSIAINVSPLNPKKNPKAPVSSNVSDDTKAMYNHSEPDILVALEEGSEDEMIVRKTSHDREENFIQNIARKVSELANKINPPKKKPPTYVFYETCQCRRGQ